MLYGINLGRDEFQTMSLALSIYLNILVCQVWGMVWLERKGGGAYLLRPIEINISETSLVWLFVGDKRPSYIRIWCTDKDLRLFLVSIVPVFWKLTKKIAKFLDNTINFVITVWTVGHFLEVCVLQAKGLFFIFQISITPARFISKDHEAELRAPVGSAHFLFASRTIQTTNATTRTSRTVNYLLESN